MLRLAQGLLGPAAPLCDSRPVPKPLIRGFGGTELECGTDDCEAGLDPGKLIEAAGAANM